GIPTLFSSHQLDVVERLCDRIVIIRSGQLVAAGTIEELAATATPRWRVVVDDGAAGAGAPAAASLTAPSPLSPALAGLPQVEVSRDSHGRLVVTASGQDEQELLAAARPLGTVRELGPVRKPLTEIFREALTAPAAGAEDSPRTEEATR
ncbi:MAG: ABC transporter ATP-binding protein, partial [Actinomyces urogenitalis]|nr:ABC transporter ATP-binding protein [Actinomyces urogenitalis]